MLCCHQCQRGRLLDTIDNCKVVFDVTQISYQSSDRVYQASRALQRKFSPYRAQKVKIAVYNVYLVEKVNEGKFCVYLVEKVNEGKFSVYLVGKVNEENSVFTEFTRCPKDFA